MRTRRDSRIGLQRSARARRAAHVANKRTASALPIGLLIFGRPSMAGPQHLMAHRRAGVGGRSRPGRRRTTAIGASRWPGLRLRPQKPVDTPSPGLREGVARAGSPPVRPADQRSGRLTCQVIDGAWRSPVSAPVWGTGGREFESLRSDQHLVDIVGSGLRALATSGPQTCWRHYSGNKVF